MNQKHFQRGEYVHEALSLVIYQVVDDNERLDLIELKSAYDPHEFKFRNHLYTIDDPYQFLVGHNLRKQALAIIETDCFPELAQRLRDLRDRTTNK